MGLSKDPIRKDADLGSEFLNPERDAVTEGSIESFPASDPPSYMAGAAVVGSPQKKGSQTKKARPGRNKASSPRRAPADEG